MKIHYNKINWIAIILISVFPLLAKGQTVLVNKGANWKYLDDGSNQGAAWKEVGFDDSGWSSGNAQLGYGDGDEVTTLSYGGDASNKYITYYFRHEFNVTNPDESLELKLEILRDDGAVVYINGKEVTRSNMQTNKFIYYDTPAKNEISGNAEKTFNEYIITSAYLVSGTNLIAVEIHQVKKTSSDISFDLKLSTVPTSTGTVLVHQNSTWEYLDGGNNPSDDSWKQNGFSGGWSSGPAELGYNDGTDDANDLDEGQVTTISYGNDSTNKPITYYFRQEFTVNNIGSGELRLDILRDDGAVVYLNGTEIARSNMPSGTINSSTTASSAVSKEYEDKYYKYFISSEYLSGGTNTIAVEIHQQSKTSSDVSFNLRLAETTGSPTGAVLVHKFSNWKYLDDGSDQGTSWKENGFDDNSWSSGNAELGYGDGDEATTLSYGGDANNKHITYYFRQRFNVSDSAESDSLILELLRDDGAVVYLNGSEVVRSNMPSGTITYTTTASSAVAGADESTFYKYVIPSSYLQSDTNLIAVEIHQRSKTSSDISFNLKLSFKTNFRKEPYLIYSGNNDEMTVLWQLYSTKNCNISWGTDQNYSTGNANTTEYGSDHQHKYTITGLNNSTKYFFKVVATSNDTITGNFVTGPADNAQNITLISYGDTRTNPDDHNSVAEQILNEYTANPSSQTILLLSGDLVADGNNEDDWDYQFFNHDYEKIQQLIRSAPILSSMGNHEGNGTLFAKYFPYPFYTSGDYYWSFDYGPVHISIIDQYSDYSVGSTQYQWLENDLKNTSKKWKILLFHKPGWSAAGGHSNDTDVQNIIQPLCENYGVQFVITGHNHYYARAFVNRVEHITSGGGGAPLYTPDPTQPNIVKTDKSFHFIKLRIEGDLLYFTAINNNGNTIETFIYKRIYTWTGATNSDWNEGSNWEMGVAPKSHSDVLIPSVSSNHPKINVEEKKTEVDKVN